MGEIAQPRVVFDPPQISLQCFGERIGLRVEIIGRRKTDSLFW
jgi:hypothetical protein